jgi:LL-diaminopimelate aminotransferase
MARVNSNYLKLKSSYLFAEIANRVQAFQAANPDKKLIRLGIGDVTEPLPEACREAMKAATDELGDRATFKGYGPSEGYAFIRNAIAETDFRSRGCDIAPDEIFLSDGSKCDSANIGEIFAADSRIAVSDPVYPVYVDSNVMNGRTGPNVDGRYDGLTYLEATAANGYVPAIPDHPVDLIYLCFPNNPTGAVATREQLAAWVHYARESKAIIVYDAAYVAFIQDPEIPRSIYEIEGARECALEMRSFSKNAGFTGVRCAFTVIPKSLQMEGPDGNPVSVHALWNRRHNTKFNGVSYPVQKAAAAVYSPEGQAQTAELVSFYMENARLIREAITEMGLSCVGGDNAPYVWIQAPGKSWDFFDRLLNEAGVVCTPGAGFGKCGEGHIRLSAFNSRANVLEAIKRIKDLGPLG